MTILKNQITELVMSRTTTGFFGVHSIDTKVDFYQRALEQGYLLLYLAAVFKFKYGPEHNDYCLGIDQSFVRVEIYDEKPSIITMEILF
jgi:hypothetical protein